MKNTQAQLAEFALDDYEIEYIRQNLPVIEIEELTWQELELLDQRGW
jgi:hypothetical protein